jgi:hypothetical protein
MLLLPVEHNAIMISCFDSGDDSLDPCSAPQSVRDMVVFLLSFKTEMATSKRFHLQARFDRLAWRSDFGQSSDCGLNEWTLGREGISEFPN